MRFGRPRPCPAGTTEEMEADGYVGLYLKGDQPLALGEIEIPTPPELLEPSICKDCNGSGTITLFTSVRDCICKRENNES